MNEIESIYNSIERETKKLQDILEAIEKKGLICKK